VSRLTGSTPNRDGVGEVAERWRDAGAGEPSMTTISRRARLAVLLVIGALTGIAPLSVDGYLPGLPEMTADLGASASAGQLTLTAFLLGLAFSQVVAGSLSDSLGRRAPVITGLVAYLATSLLCAVAPGIWWLVAMRLAQGAAAGVGFVIARAIVRDLYSGAVGARMFARLVMISGVAPVVAPILGGQLLRFTSWRGIFVAFAVISAAILVIATLHLVETLPVHLRHEPGLTTKLRVFRRQLTDRSFLPYALAASLAFAAMFAYISGAPFVLEEIHGLSAQSFSLVFGMNAFGLVTCSQISGRLVVRTGPAPLLQAGALTMATGAAGTLAAIALGAGLVPLLVGLLLTVSSIGLIVPNATGLALARQGAAAGSASALFGLGQFGLGAMLAPLAGVAGKHSALPMGIVIATCGLGALAIVRLYCSHDPLEVALEPAS
jgi:DHA1 family bicyclomycin/chloramphenicol resistance-like MFS transporter